MKNHNFSDMDYQDIVELIINFLVTFSSFEHTLKSLRYVQSGTQDTNTIRLDWQRYIRDIKSGLPDELTEIHNNDVEEAIHYLYFCPPQKEIILNGQLDYQPISTPIKIESIDWDIVAVFVWRIRNNLFHGEKSPFAKPNARDRALIFHAITLLNYFAKQSNEFHNHYLPRLNDMSIR